MKKMGILLAIVLFFSKSSAMEQKIDKHIWDKINRSIERLKYHALQKNISGIIAAVIAIKKDGRNLEEESEQKAVQDIVIIKLLRALELPDDTVNALKNAYYKLSSNESGLSSNESTPRIDENNPSISSDDEESRMIAATLGGLLEIEEEAKSQAKILGLSQDENLTRFQFLLLVVSALKKLKEQMKQAQTDIKLDLGRKDPARSIKLYTKYAGVLDVNDLNGTSKALIHYAVEVKKCKKILKFLLGQGADVEITDMHGDSPLFKAIRKNNINAVKFLLKHDANPYMDSAGHWEKAEGSQIRFVNQQQEHGKITGKSKKINKLLQSYIDKLDLACKFRFMAQAGDQEGIKKLIKEIIQAKAEGLALEAVIHSVDKRYGKSALHCAVGKKRDYMILYLIEIGVDPDQQDLDGKTSLHDAVMLDYDVGVALLLFGKSGQIKSDFEFSYKGASMDIPDKWGYTPEKIAELLGYKEISAMFRDKKRGFGRLEGGLIAGNSSENLLPKLEDDFAVPENKASARPSNGKLPKLEGSQEVENNTESSKRKKSKRASRSLSVGSFRQAIQRSKKKTEDL